MATARAMAMPKTVVILMSRSSLEVFTESSCFLKSWARTCLQGLLDDGGHLEDGNDPRGEECHRCRCS